MIERQQLTSLLLAALSCAHAGLSGEAAFKQHITLQEVQEPEGAPDMGLTLYQLATLYYAHDMLQVKACAKQSGDQGM